MTFYLLPTAMFAQSVTVCEILTVKMERTCEFIFVGTSNISPICQRLRHINSENVHALDPDLKNGPRSNVNMPIERPHGTFCVGNGNVCPICHCLQDNHL